MKLTWFGGTTLRIHIGGKIVVLDAEGAAEGIDQAELLSGSDQVVGFDEPHDLAERWSPRRVKPLISETAEEPVDVFRLGDGNLLLDAVGEPPLILATAALPALGRWAGDAVIIAFGFEAATFALSAKPRLIALAAPVLEIDAAFAALGTALDGTVMVSLERGLALEV